MPESRCTSCGRLTVPGSVNGTLPSLEPVKPHLVTLLKYAREFVDETPPGETYNAIDFLDYLALNAADGGKYVKQAGSPARRRVA